VTWTDDPELHEMFMSELSERSARLIEGGEAMIAGAVDERLATDMLREGHTIKGTGRVMGYEAVSVAGQQLELLWRRVQASEIDPHPELGAAIVAVASVLVDAGSGDPETGTPDLTKAIEQLDEALGSTGADKPTLRAVEPVGDAQTPADEGSSDAQDDADEDEELEADAVEDTPDEEPVARPRITPSTSDALPAAVLERMARINQEDPNYADTLPKSLRQRIAESQADSEEDDPPAEPAAADFPAAVASEPQEQDGFSHEHVRPRRPKPEPPHEPTAPAYEPPEVFEPPSAASIGGDLGGLLGAVESWASVETLSVSAGRMYRLINLVARIRIDLEAAEAKLKAVRNSDDLDALEANFAAIIGATNELEHDSMQLAAVPLSSMTGTLPQLVRFVAKKLGKEVRFEIVGDTEVVVDRQVLDKVADPLRQLVVNAITHGIESAEIRQQAGKAAAGSISLHATVKDRRVELVVTDDGAGVDWAKVRAAALEKGVLTAAEADDQSRLSEVLFLSGVSTGGLSDLGGSGEGLATVSETAESLFGRVRLESNLGTGTTVTMTVPTSRALQRVVIFDSAEMEWGVPEAVVEEVLPIDEVDIDWGGDTPTLDWRGQRITVTPLGEIVGAEEPRLPKQVIIVSHRIGTAAVAVQRVHGVCEVAAKELGPILAGPSHITGAALLGGGHVVLVLDAAALVGRSQVPVPATADASRLSGGDRVLVVDDSIGARAVVSGALASSGFTTSVAASAAEALDILGDQEVDALVVDFSMPQKDGAQLVEEVRARGIQVPIVMLSGVATEEDKARSKNAGVDVFFDKADFREGALAETLWEMLGRR